MVKIFKTLSEARAAREELPNKFDGFLAQKCIRKTLDGEFALIFIPQCCGLNQQTLERYNLPATTLGWLDEGEPDD